VLAAVLGRWKHPGAAAACGHVAALAVATRPGAAAVNEGCSPGIDVNSVVAEYPSPSSANAEPTPMLNTIMAARIIVLMVILLLRALSNGWSRLASSSNAKLVMKPQTKIAWPLHALLNKTQEWIVVSLPLRPSSSHSCEPS
jgi:hypothetical protein